MLNHLSLCSDAYHTLARHTFVKRSESRPEKKAAESDHKNPDANAYRTAGIGMLVFQAIVWH
jgi:hypothetical protein